MEQQSFIEKIHHYFDELNYRPITQIDKTELLKYTIWTISHCVNFLDALTALLMFKYCINNWEKIEEVFTNNYQAFNELEYTQESSFELLDENQKPNSYYLTNYLDQDLNLVCIMSYAFNPPFQRLIFSDDTFSFGNNPNFYLQYLSNPKLGMNIYSKKGDVVLSFSLNEDEKLLVNENNTNYGFICEKNTCLITTKNYEEKYRTNKLTELDKKEILALFEWQIVNPKSFAAMTQLTINNESINPELFLLIAATPFLINQNIKRTDREKVRSNKAKWRKTVRTLLFPRFKLGKY